MIKISKYGIYPQDFLPVLPLFLVLLASFGSAESHAEVNCTGLVDLDKVLNICGHRFRLKENTRQTPQGARRCKINYESAEIDGVFAPEMIVDMQDTLYNGTNKVERFFNNTKTSMQENGWYKHDISGLGDEAYYQVWDIHQKVVLRIRQYIVGIQFTSGKKSGASNRFSACPEEKMKELSREFIEEL